MALEFIIVYHKKYILDRPYFDTFLRLTLLAEYSNITMNYMFLTVLMPHPFAVDAGQGVTRYGLIHRLFHQRIRPRRLHFAAIIIQDIERT